MCIRDSSSETEAAVVDEIAQKNASAHGSSAPTNGAQVMVAGELVDLEAVSYTHLDVYKRQGVKGAKSVAA